MSAMLDEVGLAERYYELGGGRGAPVPDAGEAHDRLWLEPELARLDAARAPARVTLDAQGIHCSACVWAFEELFARQEGGDSITVDPALGRVTMDVAPGFDLRRWVEAVESIGYRLGPAQKRAEASESTLVVRTGIAIAIALNVMSFALAEYLGLREEPLRTVLREISMALSLVSLAVGAPPFVRGAIAGARARVLTLDVPIALGMALVGLGTLRAFLASGEPAFADTLAVFVALMLVGRLVEQRSLARARRRLLDGELPAIFSRRASAHGLEVVPAQRIATGDTLIVAPGEIVPVEARLLDANASVALDWVNGESEPVLAQEGETLAAGAMNAARTPLRASAVSSFEASSIARLFSRIDGGAAALPGFEAMLARGWTAAVLVLAALTFAGWSLWAGDLETALRATTAVLVVTCPCGIGIATPLARELARARLRGVGMIVSSQRTLPRAAELSRVVFDKTGTLTTGRPELSSTAPLAALSPREREVLAAITGQSSHPRAAALHRALSALGVSADASVAVQETPGKGLEAIVDGARWRLGSPAWAGGGGGDLVASVDGVVVLDLSTEERLRDGATADVAALRARGLEVFVLSGDAPARVCELARRVGVEPERAIGGASPDDKAAWLAAHEPERTLFVGDGLNDLRAASVAGLSGTPAIDRPFLPARTDFHFSSAGLGPILALLDTAADVRRVTARNLALAIAYNAMAVPIAAIGAVPPWLAALLMPMSSIVVVGSTVWSLGGARARRAHLAAEPAPAARPDRPSADPTPGTPLEGELAWKS